MLMRSEYDSVESRDPVSAANKYLPRRLLPTFNMVNIFTRQEGKSRHGAYALPEDAILDRE